MARRECCHEIEMAIFAAPTNLPISDFQTWHVCPGIDTGQKGPAAFSVSSERHWRSGVKEIAQVSKLRRWDSNTRPLNREPTCPT